MHRNQGISQSAFFIPTSSGDRFAIACLPKEDCKGAILCVHPFAEELNKSRRITALAARAAANDGWLVLQVDLCGCGDSSRDFGEAKWAYWMADITAAWNWLEDQNCGPVVLWSVRAGSLLATAWLRSRELCLPLIMWQPVSKGHTHLRQFLRIKAVGEMLDKASASGVVDKLLTQLDSGHSVEVAGYEISSDLYENLRAAEMSIPDGYNSDIRIVEVRSGNSGAPSPAMAALARRLETACSAEVLIDVISGPQFWRTVEIEEVPDLVGSFIDMLGSVSNE